MDIVKVTFNDNTVHEYKKGTLFYDASKDFDMENIVGYKINNEVFSLDNKILEDVKVDFINTNDLIGNRIYKAGLKFLFLVSLQEVFNDFDVVYEHSVPRGMLGVLKGPRVLSHEDISKIKARMCKLISDNEIITKLNVSAKDAIKYFNDKKEYEKANKEIECNFYFYKEKSIQEKQIEKDIIFREGKFWLASPGVDGNCGYADFGLGAVYGGFVFSDYGDAFGSNGGWDVVGKAVRPVGILKSDIPIKDLPISEIVIPRLRIKLS